MHKAPIERFRGLKQLSSEAELQCTPRAERRFYRTIHHERPKPEPNLRKTENRQIRSHHHVPLRYQTHTAAERCAIDTDHQRLQRCGADRKQIVVRPKQSLPAVLSSFVQIHSRAENASGCAQQNTADVASLLRFVDGANDA